jgi:hypothetical protein
MWDDDRNVPETSTIILFCFAMNKVRHCSYIVGKGLGTEMVPEQKAILLSSMSSTPQIRGNYLIFGK